MHRIFFVGLTCLIYGCTTIEHKSLDMTSNDELMGKTIQASLYEAPSFIAHTTSSGLATATGGLLGGLAGASGAAIYGNQIVEQYLIKDPAGQIAIEMANKLSAKYGLEVHQGESTVSPSDNLETLKTTYGSTDYLLDVKSISWGFSYFPTDWNNYQVFYGARMRFIRVRDLAVLAEEWCEYKPSYSDTDDAPTYDDLLSDDAKVLKDSFEAAVSNCEALFDKTLSVQ
jgi:hypothetical protein